jgi:hypothetical protein
MPMSADPSGNVLCLAMDPQGTRAAVPVAVSKAEESRGSLLTLVAFESLSGWQARLWALEPHGFDPATTAMTEVARLVGPYVHRSRCVPVDGQARILDLAESILAEGYWSNLVVGQGAKVIGELGGLIAARPGDI